MSLLRKLTLRDDSGLTLREKSPRRFSIVVNGEVTGDISIANLDDRKGVLNTEIDEKFRGRSYGKRASRLLTEWALADGGYLVISSRVNVENLASQRASLYAGLKEIKRSPKLVYFERRRVE